jgi:hypothetical protein
LEVEENTLIQDSEEMKSDVEFYLTVDDEESSEDEEENSEKEHADRATSPETDIWKELDEMIAPSPQETLLCPTAVHDIPKSTFFVNTDTSNDMLQPAVTQIEPLPNPDIESKNTAKSAKRLQDNLGLFKDLTDSDNEKISSILDDTLYDDIFTIPELGTFKRRKQFNSLVTVQLIEKMLSQSITLKFHIANKQHQPSQKTPGSQVISLQMKPFINIY